MLITILVIAATFVVAIVFYALSEWEARRYRRQRNLGDPPGAHDYLWNLSERERRQEYARDSGLGDSGGGDGGGLDAGGGGDGGGGD